MASETESEKEEKEQFFFRNVCMGMCVEYTNIAPAEETSLLCNPVIERLPHALSPHIHNLYSLSTAKNLHHYTQTTDYREHYHREPITAELEGTYFEYGVM